MPANWPLPKFIRRDRARERIIGALKPVIDRRRRNPEQYNDLITQVLAQPEKDGGAPSDEDIVRLFMGLLFAGHETTAGQAAWTVIQLLQNPDYLRLVQDEIGAVVAPGQAIDGGVLRNLEHVYWAIEETTRLKPSAPMQMRIVEEDLDLGDVVVPAGWLIKVSAATSHHNEAAFAENEQYDPLRFAPGRDEGKNTFNIIGFGGGIHKCTGMNFAKNEMAVVVALLFQQFDVELVTQDPRVVTGLGANHPSEAIVRYRRKGNAETISAPLDAVAV
ncbi:MAG: cytochrome P450 [Caldilineaceae bacterium]